MRAPMVLICLLLCSCSCGKKGTGAPEDAGVDVPAPPPPPPPVLGAALDLAEGGSAGLDGGTRVHVLAGSGPAGASVTARLVPADAVVELPHTGAAARIGPTLVLTVPASARRPVLVEIPFDAGGLPGGLGARNVYAAAPGDGSWTVLPGLRSGERICASTNRSTTVALLADAGHETPQAKGIALALLALLPASLGPHPPAQAVPAEPLEEPPPLYVLDTVAGTIVTGGRAFDVMETKDRQKDGSPRLLAVRKKGAGFATSPAVIGRVLLAHAVRQRLSRVDLAALAGMLADDAALLAASWGRETDVSRLVAAAGAGEVPPPGSDESIEAWQSVLSDAETRTSIEEALLALEVQRTMVACAALASRIASLDTTTDDGDALVEIHATLTWLLARLDAVHDLAARGRPADAVAGAWHGYAQILAALVPGAPKGKPPIGEPASVQPSTAVDLEALSTALSPIDPGAPSLAGLLASAPDLLPGIAALSGPPASDWAGADLVLAGASEVASRPAMMAPPPDTEIKGYKFKNGMLTVVASGTDEDGKVAGMRWWFDDGQDQHLAKGKGLIKANLSSLRSGSHDIFVAAIDDDGQRDPTAARLAFYVRRSVDLRSQNLEIAFDAQPWNVNSEHARSIRTFVRELLGPIQECADDHYRWGIDGGGKVTLSFAFRGESAVNVAKSATVVKDTFKNDTLAGCIRKAVKTPRMRYNQDYQPGATVTVTFQLVPVILFFDAASLGDAPGPDVMGATLYLRCADKALKKIEAMCDAAVRALPGPWDAQKWLGGEEDDGSGQDADAGEAEEDEQEAVDEDDARTDASVPPEPVEKVVIPPPEFDAIEIHASCVARNVLITLEVCRVHLTKKRLWCVDSCQKKAKSCAQTCKKAADWAEDPFTCRELCWTDEAFPCAEHCAVKNTPLEKEEAPAEGPD